MSLDASAKPSILITTARIFGGVHGELSEQMSVLVAGNKIAKIAPSIAAPDGAAVMDAKGRTRTPGFIVTQEHLVGPMPFGDIFTTDTRDAAYVATPTTRTCLMNGFPAARDPAGNTFSRKMAIDRGYRENALDKVEGHEIH